MVYKNLKVFLLSVMLFKRNHQKKEIQGAKLERYMNNI